VLPSNRTEADFQARRNQEAWTAEKYRQAALEKGSFKRTKA
jgi:hypothetical protein